jgi:phosphoglycolate phosphatase
VRARLIIFDLDGTLVDASADLTSSLNATFARLRPGTPPLALDAVRGMIGEGATVLVTRALDAACLDLPVEDVLPVYMDCYAERLLETTRPYPGVVELLDALAPRTLAVLTNKPGGMSRAVLAGLGLSVRFRRIYGGGDLATRKPDPEGLLRLLEEAGAPRGEALMVGDSAIDVRTARAAGVRVVGVDWGFDPEGLRREPPDALISRPAELLPMV